MKTVYAAALSRLGLSHAEAAELHAVRKDTVHSWASGRNRVPAGVWDDLRALEAKIQGDEAAAPGKLRLIQTASRVLGFRLED